MRKAGIVSTCRHHHTHRRRRCSRRRRARAEVHRTRWARRAPLKIPVAPPPPRPCKSLCCQFPPCPSPPCPSPLCQSPPCQSLLRRSPPSQRLACWTRPCLSPPSQSAPRRPRSRPRSSPSFPTTLDLQTARPRFCLRLRPRLHRRRQPPSAWSPSRSSCCTRTSISARKAPHRGMRSCFSPMPLPAIG